MSKAGDDTCLVDEAVVRAITRRVVAELLSDGPTLRRLALAEMSFLSIRDLAAITGKSRNTIRKWERLGYVRMFQLPDSEDLATTVEMWGEDLRRLVEMGLLRRQNRVSSQP